MQAALHMAPYYMVHVLHNKITFIITISFAFQQYKVPYKFTSFNIPQFYSTIITAGNNEIICKL